MREREARTEFRPVLVVGNERSGTTLLAAWLGRHSELAALPETHFFREVLPRDWRRKKELTHATLAGRMLAAPRARDLGFDGTTFLNQFLGYPSTYPQLFRCVLEHFAAGLSKPRAVEKSPHHLLYIPQVLEWFPRAKVVCIVRDGRDVAMSLARAPWTHDDLHRHCIVWRRLVRIGQVFEQRFAENFRRVHFEDLVQKPEKTLALVDDFVGVEFEPSQLDVSIRTSVVPDWERPWKDKAHHRPDASRIGVWMREANREQKWLMNSVMGRELRDLGYSDTSVGRCPLVCRIETAALTWIYLAAYTSWLHPAAQRINEWLSRRRART